MRNIYDIFEERKLHEEYFDLINGKSEINLEHLLVQLDECSNYTDDIYLITESINKENIKKAWDRFVKFVTDLWDRFLSWVDVVIGKMKKKQVETSNIEKNYDVRDVLFKVRDNELNTIYYKKSVKECINDALGFNKISNTVLKKLYEYEKYVDLGLTSDSFILKYTAIEDINGIPNQIFKSFGISEDKAVQTKKFNNISSLTIQNSLSTYDEAIRSVEKAKQDASIFYKRELNKLKNSSDEEFKKKVGFLTRIFKIHQILIRYSIIGINKVYMNHVNIFKKAIEKYEGMENNS
jgi:hypothetical protein